MSSDFKKLLNFSLWFTVYAAVGFLLALLMMLSVTSMSDFSFRFFGISMLIGSFALGFFARHAWHLIAVVASFILNLGYLQHFPCGEPPCFGAIAIIFLIPAAFVSYLIGIFSNFWKRRSQRRNSQRIDYN